MSVIKSVFQRLVLLASAATSATALGAQGAAPAQAPPIASYDSAWAAIHRTYWDTVFLKDVWQGKHDSIRSTLTSADHDGVRAGIRGLISVPGKSHFVLIPGSVSPPVQAELETPDRPQSAPGTTGIEPRMIGDTLVVWRVATGSPAALAGIKAGMIITHIDTNSIESVKARLIESLPDDTTQALRLLNTLAMGMLSGRAGDTVSLLLTNGNNTGSASASARTIVRGPMMGSYSRFGNLPPIVVRTVVDSSNIGSRGTVPVISFTAWLPAIISDLDRHLFAARSAPGVIFDLRGNPGGVVGMVAGVSGHFLDSSTVLGTLWGRNAKINFVANPRRVDSGGSRVAVLTVPLAILVDEFTASTSEFFASGMQGVGRARIFGVRSAGQALPAVMGRLPNGDVLMHVIADHEDAIGRRVEGNGVQPDQLTPLNREDLLNGRDAALEAARLWLAQSNPN